MPPRERDTGRRTGAGRGVGVPAGSRVRAWYVRWPWVSGTTHRPPAARDGGLHEGAFYRPGVMSVMVSPFGSSTGGASRGPLLALLVTYAAFVFRLTATVFGSDPAGSSASTW